MTAFEAAARHGSFARAADELCITQSAVSHRIKLLEQTVDAKLFLRFPRCVVLTPQGTQLLQTVRSVLTQLEDAAGQMSSSARRVVRVTIVPSLARHWFVQRLGDFFATVPWVDLEVEATSRFPVLSAGDTDVAIVYGKGGWDNVQYERLMPDELFPVCGPAYFEAHEELRALSGLQRVPLLRHTMDRWDTWFRAAGLPWPEPVQGPLYSDGGLCLEAAANGQGVALARGVVAERYLSDGRLMRLFEVSAPAEYAYYVLHHRPGQLRPEARAFVDWLRLQAR